MRPIEEVKDLHDIFPWIEPGIYKRVKLENEEQAEPALRNQPLKGGISLRTYAYYVGQLLQVCYILPVIIARMFSRLQFCNRLKIIVIILALTRYRVICYNRGV